MYKTDFAYDGPIFLVPLSPSYPSSPVLRCHMMYVTSCYDHHINVALQDHGKCLYRHRRNNMLVYTKYRLVMGVIIAIVQHHDTAS